MKSIVWLIDENNTIARLADHSPGMEWLNPFLYGIWQVVNTKSNPIENRDLIVRQVKNLIDNSERQFHIPPHLNRFVLDSIPSWVDHAISAKIEYRLDHQYMIKNDEMRIKRIMPIDFLNTGVIQCNTTWSDGLHQFLQIKHGLKITPLTLTTNYLSNIGLFTRYKDQIYGFSGTLGSTDARDLLREIYQVDTIIIPSFKQKRHFQLKTILEPTDSDWLNIIVQNTIAHVSKSRAVLIICETRLDAKTIFKELQHRHSTSSIRLYTDNTDDNESIVVLNRIEPSEIIVATNLAGRGTDLKTSQEVENHGGLHICLTFLPKNLRIEEQALGRTSRQGNRGTSQLILNRDRTLLKLMSWYPDYWNDHSEKFTDPIDINLIYDWRAKAESTHLDQIGTKEIPEIKEKDQVFKKFCKLLGQLQVTKVDFYQLLSVKERWGLWLKSFDHVAQSRRTLERTIKEAGFRCGKIPSDDNSFFHAISHQLRGQMNSTTIENEIFKHISNNKNLYKDEKEEQRYRATSRALNINIVLFHSDYLYPYVYKRENADRICFIGYQVPQILCTS